MTEQVICKHDWKGIGWASQKEIKFCDRCRSSWVEGEHEPRVVVAFIETRHG